MRCAARTCARPAIPSGWTEIIRIDPATGAAHPGNAAIGASDPNERRIIASGLRNPFRLTNRPETDEIWLGDVGWNDWEINRIPNPTAPRLNFGWPCYEGATGGPTGKPDTTART